MALSVLVIRTSNCGIDSCAVLGLAQQQMDRPIRAFTLTFDNPLYDEARIAEAQARHVGATYHPIPITGRQIAESFADAIWHAETQMFNGHGVAKYLFSRAVRAAGIKVVFTGEGADEMLGGYPYFRVDALNDDPALTADEKSALLTEMLGANPATRALLMPDQVSSPEMQAVQRRLDWLPAKLNMAAAQTNCVAPMFRDDLPASVREFHRWPPRWIGCRWRNASPAATGCTRCSMSMPRRSCRISF